MEIRKLEKEEKRRTSFFNTIILFLFGVFLTTVIFALSIQLLDQLGLWIGIAITIILIIGGFYYTEPSTALRKITWGLLVTLVGGTLAFFIGLQIVNQIWTDI